MSFNIKKREGFKYNSPQEMYQDNKIKKIRGLLDYQGTMIDQYMSNSDKKNIALELPTGSGKTLIGLLIGEYRRKKNKEKIVFLCPTKQLVNQAVSQATNKYGINALAFCGKQRDYLPCDKTSFNMAEAIGVTTYSAFFTQETMFDDVDVIIMDDVHSCEEYIISNWTIKIDKSNSLFMVFANILKNIIGESDYERLITDDESRDIEGWCNLVPITLLFDVILILEKQIDLGLDEGTSNFYAWKRIKENFSECNIYLNNREILIRPWIAPTMTYSPYKKAKQRILMSATLGKSGELERITGTENITTLPIVSDWDKKGLGRRFFIIPELSLSDEHEAEIFLNLHKATNQKTVVLVPDDQHAKSLDEFVEENCPEANVYHAKDIEQSKENFIEDNNAITILANRFDGIDFADDESRMLFIIDLPKVTNIQERFLVTRMGASILFAERIRTRIIQAVGRCSRNPSDYSVVCILGNTIQNDLIKHEKLKMYPPELRAELQFGIDMSKQYKDVPEILEQVNDFLSRNENWQDAERYIVDLRDEYCTEKNESANMVFVKLKKAAQHELKYQYSLWKKNYKAAYEETRNIISILNAPSLSGYRSYWQYIAGSLAYICFKLGETGYQNICVKHYERALKDNISIKWLEKLIYQVTNKSEAFIEDNFVGDLISNIEDNLIQYNLDSKFESKIKMIVNDLSSMDGNTFERGHRDLGEMLGYISINVNSTAAPDPYWIVNQNLCIVSEDKIYATEESEIPVKHVKEAMGHKSWILTNEKRIGKQCEVITIMLTNTEIIEDGARTFAKDIWYVNREDFVKWALDALSAIREMRRTFIESGDMEWRNNANNIMNLHKTTPKNFLQYIKSKKLFEL